MLSFLVLLLTLFQIHLCPLNIEWLPWSGTYGVQQIDAWHFLFSGLPQGYRVLLLAEQD